MASLDPPSGHPQSFKNKLSDSQMSKHECRPGRSQMDLDVLLSASSTSGKAEALLARLGILHEQQPQAHEPLDAILQVGRFSAHTPYLIAKFYFPVLIP